MWRQESFILLFIQADYRLGKQYVELADFFLEHIDHGQEQAVNLAYEFYKLSKAVLLCAVLFSAVSGERDGGFEADRAGKGARLVCVRGVHGKRWTKRRRGRFGRLELQEYRWGAHNAAGWRMACRAAKK